MDAAAIGANDTETSSLTRAPSGLPFQFGFFGRIDGRRRLAPEHCALEPNVTRHSRGCNQQRSKRDEKANH
jgi:hypothetical protein